MSFIRISTIILAFLLIVPAIVQGNQDWDDAFIDTPSGRFHVWMSGEGIPVLLLHGNTASGRWFTLLDVPDGYLAIAPDLPGFGSSFKPGIFDIAYYSLAVLGLLDEMDLQKSFIMGHSLGGAVAIELVSSYPDRFQALILANSIPFSNAKLAEEYLSRAAGYSSDDVLLKSALQAVSPTLTDQDISEIMFAEARKMDPEGFMGNPRALTTINQSNKLASFGKPVLFLASELDLTIPASYMRYFSSITPLARYHEIKGIGHAPMLEDPSGFQEAVFSFVKEISDN